MSWDVPEYVFVEACRRFCHAYWSKRIIRSCYVNCTSKIPSLQFASNMNSEILLIYTVDS